MSNSPELKRAESEVKQSTKEFERAMGHLEGTVESTTAKVQGAVEMLKRPQQMLAGYIDTIVDTYDRAYAWVRHNRRAVGYGVGAVLAGLLVRIFLNRRAKSMSIDVKTQDSFNVDRPIIESPTIDAPGPTRVSFDDDLVA